MATRHTTEFKQEAVRIALTCRLTRRQAASDIGIGFSTLSKWIRQSRDDEEILVPDQDLFKEVEWLREEHRHRVPIERLCNILNNTSRGYRAWRDRPVSLRQRDDMIILAHIREQHRLSLGSYGRPRMTEELKELGINVGHRRVGRLMRQNAIRVVRTRKYKATTDSNHRFNIAPNRLNQNFTAERPNQKWAGDISYIWTREGWSYLSLELILAQYIDEFYNPRCRHSTLGGKSPIQFERKAAKTR